MTTQRAIRRLKTDPVPDELVLRLIELALRAPTGSNAAELGIHHRERPSGQSRAGALQPAVMGAVRRYWAASLPGTTLSGCKIVEAVQWQADHFEQAPVIVVPCLKGSYIPFLHITAATYFGSIFPAVQNLLLAARAVNLGAALTTIPLWNVMAVRRILGLPWRVTPCAVIPLGWPRQERGDAHGRYGPTTRKPVNAVVSYDRFGQRKAG